MLRQSQFPVASLCGPACKAHAACSTALQLAFQHQYVLLHSANVQTSAALILQGQFCQTLCSDLGTAGATITVQGACQLALLVAVAFQLPAYGDHKHLPLSGQLQVVMSCDSAFLGC